MKPTRFLFTAICLLAVLAACVPSAGSPARQITPTGLPVTATATATPTPAPTATPACSQSMGTTQQLKINSPTLGEKFTFTIYLPPCYRDDAPGGYPILYLFHGQNMDDTYWPFTLGMVKLADQEIGSGNLPFIMVFPYEVHDWDPPADSKFGTAFMNDLVPYVESHYAVCLERSCQAIGGLSRGGGWAMHIALTNFSKFGSIGAHSMGYFRGDLYRIENLLKDHPASDFPRIYMDRGQDDYLKPNIDEYEANLTSCGVPHEFHISPGSHDEAYWQSQAQTYLGWYIAGFENSFQ